MADSVVCLSRAEVSDSWDVWFDDVDSWTARGKGGHAWVTVCDSGCVSGRSGYAVMSCWARLGLPDAVDVTFSNCADCVVTVESEVVPCFTEVVSDSFETCVID